MSSATPRVARINTIATRRQLLPPLTPSQWHRLNPSRTLWAGARPLAEDKDKKSRSTESQESSISKEIFPDEITFRYRRNPSRQQDNRIRSKSSSKVRIVTSTHVDKSEATEWNARQQAARAGRMGSYWKKKQAAVSKIPELLVPKSKAWGLGSSYIPPLGSKPGEDNDKGIGRSTADETTKHAPSLFDKLFKSEDPLKKTTPQVENRSVYHGDLQAWIDSLPREDGGALSAADKEKPAMLILSNASTNLGESDFYRVGPQGQHLDGWGASISKVLQAYDYNTLQPLGRYFILFDSHAAAAAYQIEAQRRYSLTRQVQQSPTAPFTSPFEKDDTVFTLVPPSRAPLSLHLYKVTKAMQNRLDAFSIQGLLSMTPDPPPRCGTQVIFSVQGSTLDRRSLSQWIRRDARDRGLAWPIRYMRAYFPSSKVHRKRSTDEPEVYNYEWGEDTAPTIIDREKQANRPMDDTARSALFVLSFPDVHEARRFVRAWHKRELDKPRGHLIVNTHVVW